MAIEEQGRLSLHDHILVWLHGHDRLRERMLQDGGPERLQQYLDRMLSASLPVPPDRTDASTLCPAANCNATLGPASVLFGLAHKCDHGIGHNPPILECNSDTATHTCSPDDVADTVLADWWKACRQVIQCR
jgi:hypothetical protein